MVFRNVFLDPDEDPQDAFVQLIIAAPDVITLTDPLPIIPSQQSEVLKRLMAFYRPVPQDLKINANASV
jgi:hypothetical protein